MNRISHVERKGWPAWANLAAMKLHLPPWSTPDYVAKKFVEDRLADGADGKLLMVTGSQWYVEAAGHGSYTWLCYRMSGAYDPIILHEDESRTGVGRVRTLLREKAGDGRRMFLAQLRAAVHKAWPRRESTLSEVTQPPR